MATKNENATVEMNVKHMLDFNEFTDAVNGIVNGCFDNDTGEVLYEVVDLIERLEVIERYTDYALPDDINEVFKVIYETDVYEKARKNIDDNQLVRLFAAAEAKLEAKEKRANAEAQAGVQAVMARFEQLSEQMGAAFGGVTPEQINDVFNAMVDGVFDEGKIVDAIMKREKKEDREV